MVSVSIRNLDLSYDKGPVLKDLNLDIEEGEFLVLLGSSGCGKSTLLNCIAGLLDIDDGQIFINGSNVTWSEPKDRGVGMVFQSYALYPQMTVAGNLSFGLKNSKMKHVDVAKRVERVAKTLHIDSLLKRKPSQLSGGERQRVAIGRALVRDVDVFLFDEPLSNLDAKLRSKMRLEIKRLHERLKGNTMIYVTHDQMEAMTLGDRIAVMEEGKIRQLADPHTIYTDPANKYVAGFIGTSSINFLEGRIELDGSPRFVAEGITIDLKRYKFRDQPREQKASFGIRPEHIRQHRAAGLGFFEATVVVDVVEPMGPDTLVWATLCGQEVHFRLAGRNLLQPQTRVSISLDPSDAFLFDAESGARL